MYFTHTFPHRMFFLNLCSLFRSHCLRTSLVQSSFFLRVSRSSCSNCHARDVECTQNTSPDAQHAHIFLVRARTFTVHLHWHKISECVPNVISSLMSCLPFGISDFSSFCFPLLSRLRPRRLCKQESEQKTLCNFAQRRSWKTG